MPEYDFDYDTTPPDEAMPDSDARRKLIPIESTSDGGIIAWAVDHQHAAAIVRTLRVAAGEYESEMSADCWVDGEIA